LPSSPEAKNFRIERKLESIQKKKKPSGIDRWSIAFLPPSSGASGYLSLEISKKGIWRPRVQAFSAQLGCKFENTHQTFSQHHGGRNGLLSPGIISRSYALSRFVVDLYYQQTWHVQILQSSKALAPNYFSSPSTSTTDSETDTFPSAYSIVPASPQAPHLSHL